jgi:hypothetical protein
MICAHSWITPWAKDLRQIGLHVLASVYKSSPPGRKTGLNEAASRRTHSRALSERQWH